MSTLPFKPEGTVQSRLLCEEISKRSGGICILAFSRGKDSIPAWVWLREFFHTIYVYHMAPAPKLEYVETSLQYYEKVFESPILRFIDGEVLENIKGKSLQFLSTYELIDSLNFPTGYYAHEEMARVVRDKYNCPNAWHAMAMLANDNMFRLLNLRKKSPNGELSIEGGFSRRPMTFYPTFDWTLAQNVEVLVNNNIHLPDDYLMSHRTISSIPGSNVIEALVNNYPADFEKIQALFPLIKTDWARNQFRRMKASTNGVVKKTIKEVLSERAILAEKELEYARNSNERKSGKRLARRK